MIFFLAACSHKDSSSVAFHDLVLAFGNQARRDCVFYIAVLSFSLLLQQEDF
jgi:hypothetical protein